mmetsp:Transcript_1432/g.2232  ORF Transcript_1432/g.2232 Transcript_1432/m.2232 type:complete len:98 (+) Transcript_1432:239-532(+)
MGRKNGNPIASIPSKIGSRTTVAATRDTAGTTSIFPNGIFLGTRSTEVNELIADDDPAVTWSIAPNQLVDIDIIAEISGLNGPVMHSLNRRVGGCVS